MRRMLHRIPRSSTTDIAISVLVGLLILGLVWVGSLEVSANKDRISVARQSDVRQAALLRAIQDSQDRLLQGVSRLLSRPTITRTINRRVVIMHGVKTVFITRTITRSITRTVTRTVIKRVVICQLPNGNPCPK